MTTGCTIYFITEDYISSQESTWSRPFNIYRYGSASLTHDALSGVYNHQCFRRQRGHLYSIGQVAFVRYGYSLSVVAHATENIWVWHFYSPDTMLHSQEVENNDDDFTHKLFSL